MVSGPSAAQADGCQLCSMVLASSFTIVCSVAQYRVKLAPVPILARTSWRGRARCLVRRALLPAAGNVSFSNLLKLAAALAIRPSRLLATPDRFASEPEDHPRGK
jgi:hypothetical protein